MPEQPIPPTETQPYKITIPDEAALPKPEKRPSHRPEIRNHADQEKTVAKALAWVGDYKNEFDGQGAWTAFDTELDIADILYRAGATRTELNADQAANVKDTGSKVKSCTYNSDIRIITTGQKAVILGSRSRLPVEYEPIPGLDAQAQKVAQDRATGYNLLLYYTIEADGMWDKIGTAFLRTNKNANHLVELAWDYRKEERWIREVIPGAEGQKDKISFKRKTITVADNPTWLNHDMKDCWFDAMVPDPQNWFCYVIQKQMQYSDIVGKRKTGEWKNVEKITKDHQYTGENKTRNQLETRQTHAGETPDSGKPTASGLFNIWYGRIRLPVDDEAGDWDEEGQIPHWYDYVFVGNELDEKAVCVQLSPHWHPRIPVLLLHSHEDDKGALSYGYSVLVKSLVAQEMTAFDQAVDNNDGRNRVPMVLERGSISIRDKTFAAGGNQVWWKTPGAADPHEIQIQDTTQNTFNMLDRIDQRRMRATGLNKTRLGEELGGRTSAFESSQVIKQALDPALEDSAFMANQALLPLAFWNKEFWDVFGDPEDEKMLSYEGQQYRVKPGKIWGDVNMRVTAIKHFQDSILKRREEDLFINQSYSMVAPLLRQEGRIGFWQEIAKNRGIDSLTQSEAWGLAQDYDARHVAKSENMAVVWNGIYDMPKPDELHAAHLAEHEPYLAAIVLLPEEERPPMRNIQMMKTHIQLHRNMVGGGQPGAPAMPQAMIEGVNEAETFGNVMGAEGGAAEQNATPGVGAAERPATGRPPGVSLGQPVEETMA